MDMMISEKVTVKIFVGCWINPEIKMLLTRSRFWKHASITPKKSNELELREIHFDGKDYIGNYLSEDRVTLADIKKLERFVLSRLKSYFPDNCLAPLSICIFPQVFVA